MSEKSSPPKYFISGGIGGICTVLVGHPMDTLKVRLQTMPVPKAGEKPLYAGTWDCLVKTVKHEGVSGLYKGMSAPLLAVTPIFAISFFSFGFGKRLLVPDVNVPLTKPQICAAGGFSGIFTTIVMTPGERVKCLLQIQKGGKEKPKYAGMVDCAKQLYREGGMRSLYRGTIPTLMRDVPASGVYFTTYEWVKEVLIQPNSTTKQMVLYTIFSGGMAGIFNWIVAMPADVLKNRLQCAPEGRYTGLGQVVRELLQKEGPTAFYKGFTPVMIRAFPANAACFGGFEVAVKVIDWLAPNL